MKPLARAVVLAAFVSLTTSAPLFAQQAVPPPQAAKPASADSGWDVVIYPVLGWLPVFGANVRLPEILNPPPCDGCGDGGSLIPEGSTSSSLNMAAFAKIRLEKGRLALASDFNWAALSGSRDRPFLTLKVDLYVWGVSGGYRLARDLYLEGGVRNVIPDLSARILVFPEVTWSPSIWQPVVGTTYRPQLGKRWWLYTHVDAGGLGVTDNWTATATARAEWRPARHFALTLGYGYLYLRADGKVGSKDIHVSATSHGPIAGFGIPF